MAFIGIDLGTSFIKGAVLNVETRQVERSRRVPFPNPLPNLNSLIKEFDPAEVVDATRLLIEDLADGVPDCEGLVMCSQMHGMVLAGQRGAPESNCITWLDHRGLMPHPAGQGTYFDLLTSRATNRQRAQLGQELMVERPICSLFWMAEQGFLKPGLIPASLPDFVLSTLCRTEPGVEATNASAYGAFNLEASDWHHELIEQLGLGNLHWPPLRPCGEVVGELKVGTKKIPCYTPVGDFQCSLLGAFVASEELSLNISTGSQVSRLTKGLALGDYQTRPYFDGMFLNTFTGAPGGRTLNVLVDLLSEAGTQDAAELWTYIAKASSEVTETDLEIELFGGADERPGKILIIRTSNFTLGHLFRAAFKQMAKEYHARALQLWPERCWENLLLTGGLAWKLAGLRDAIQKEFATDYRLCPSVDDSLSGLLVLALVFSGRGESVTSVAREMRSCQP